MEAQGEVNRTSDRIHADYESRLRALGRWRYTLPTAVILGAISVGVTLVGYFHPGH